MPDFFDRLGEELRRATVAEALQPLPAPAALSVLAGRRPRRLREAGPLRGRRWLISFALLIVAGAGGAAVAIESGPNPGPVPPQAGAPLAAAPEPDQLAAFAILRRPRTASDEVPRTVTTYLSGASGANRGLAHHVAGPAGTSAWVVPGRGSMCILASWARGEQSGARCSENATAVSGRLDLTLTSVSTAGAQLLAGLVPDGVSQVVVHLRSGAEQQAPVSENVYISVLHSAWQAITFTGPHGPVEVQDGSGPGPLPSKRG
jgi:hypothetical protein